ncbi:MAG: hypothetical protein ACK5LJ_07090 [Paracoccus sp. (in: a-proteobacteria)]
MATLKDLSISFLSLVRVPATGKALTLKSTKPGERAGTFDIVKTDTDDERMVAFGIVYAPDQVDMRLKPKQRQRRRQSWMRSGEGTTPSKPP